MIKTTLGTALILLGMLGHAQKINIKKDVLYKDDVPVGKVDGKATLLKGTNVSIQSVAGTSLVTITDPLAKFGSVFYEPIRYYKVKFIPFSKTATFIPDGKRFYTSEKKLVEYMFETFGEDFLTADGLNEQVIDKYLAEKDQSKKISNDTLRIAYLIKVGDEKLKEPLVQRPMDGKLHIRSAFRETQDKIWNVSYEEFEIYFGGVTIGRISKLYKGDPAITPSGSGPQSKEVHYIVKRIVSDFEVDGKNEKFVDFASVKSSVSGPDIYVKCDQIKVYDLKVGDIYSAESDIVSWLISKGCL